MPKSDHFNIEDFKNDVKLSIQRARTLDEITLGLRSRSFVRSVELSTHLLKSNPPQRELIVEIELTDGTTNTMMVHFFELGNQRYQFNAILDMDI